MSTKAFYPGSFDPLTNGHLDILVQALDCFDEVVVGIGVHPGKAPMFSFEERADLIMKTLEAGGGTYAGRTSVVSFKNLVVDAARDHSAGALVRGLRDSTDFNYEMQMAGMNGTMSPGLRTVFFPATPAVRFITGTLVRQIAKMGGDVSEFVPGPVLGALDAKTG